MNIKQLQIYYLHNYIIYLYINRWRCSEKKRQAAEHHRVRGTETQRLSPNPSGGEGGSHEECRLGEERAKTARELFPNALLLLLHKPTLHYNSLCHIFSQIFLTLSGTRWAPPQAHHIKRKLFLKT